MTAHAGRSLRADHARRPVEKRLRADVPVGSYLSGGVDSSMIAALACHLKGPAINTYTIRVDAPELDELDAANLVARHIGTKPPIVQEFRAADALNTYPELIQAAEAPVIDTSSAALLQLARRVHAMRPESRAHRRRRGRMAGRLSVVQSGEALRFLRCHCPACALSDLARRAYLRLQQRAAISARVPARRRRSPSAARTPGSTPTGCSALSKLRFYSRVDARSAGETQSVGAICRCRWNAPDAGTRSTAASGSRRA